MSRIIFNGHNPKWLHGTCEDSGPDFDTCHIHVEFLPLYGLIFSLSCVKPGVELDDPCGSFPTLNILWFCKMGMGFCKLWQSLNFESVASRGLKASVLYHPGLCSVSLGRMPDILNFCFIREVCLGLSLWTCVAFMVINFNTSTPVYLQRCKNMVGSKAFDFAFGWTQNPALWGKKECWVCSARSSFLQDALWIFSTKRKEKGNFTPM